MGKPVHGLHLSTTPSRWLLPQINHVFPSHTQPDPHSQGFSRQVGAPHPPRPRPQPLPSGSRSVGPQESCNGSNRWERKELRVSPPHGSAAFAPGPLAAAPRKVPCSHTPVEPLLLPLLPSPFFALFSSILAPLPHPNHVVLCYPLLSLFVNTPSAHGRAGLGLCCL